MKFKNYCLIFLTVIFLFSCAPGIRTSVTKPFVTEISTWPQQFERNFSRIKTFEGNARLTIESLEFSGHVSVKTYWIESDTLFFQAGGPLGIDIGKMLIGKTRFIIYNQFENQFLAGSLDDPYIGKFLQTDIYLKDLKQAVIGRPLFFSSSVILTDPKQGIFSDKRGSDDYRYVVNPVTGLLERWEKLDNDQSQIIQEFKNYHEIDGVYIPYLIQITLPVEQQRMSIFYKSVTINKPIDPKVYSIEIGPKVKQANLN